MSNPETTPKTLPFQFHFDPSAFAEEYGRLEKEMLARARQAIETWAQLAKDALAYSAQLAEQARKLGLDTARKLS